jgi:hypothetical protein
MFTPRAPRQDAGQPITAQMINATARNAEKAVRLQVAAPLATQGSAPGLAIVDSRSQPFYAKLSGARSPYDFVEVYPPLGGGFADLPGGRTGQVYEVNSVAGLAGKSFQIMATTAGDFRFQAVLAGKGGNVTIKATLCGGLPFAGLPVTVTGPDGFTLSGVTALSFSVPTTGDYTITVTGPNGPATETVHLVAGETTTITISLPSLIAVKVTDCYYGPRAGVTVTVKNSSGVTVGTCTTGGDGSCTFIAIGPLTGTYSVSGGGLVPSTGPITNSCGPINISTAPDLGWVYPQFSGCQVREGVLTSCMVGQTATGTQAGGPTVTGVIGADGCVLLTGFLMSAGPITVTATSQGETLNCTWSNLSPISICTTPTCGATGLATYSCVPIGDNECLSGMGICPVFCCEAAPATLTLTDSALGVTCTVTRTLVDGGPGFVYQALGVIGSFAGGTNGGAFFSCGPSSVKINYYWLTTNGEECSVVTQVYSDLIETPFPECFGGDTPTPCPGTTELGFGGTTIFINTVAACPPTLLWVYEFTPLSETLPCAGCLASYGGAGSVPYPYCNGTTITITQ